MKLAIPTDDGFTINQHLDSAKGFLISTIQFGEVVEQEIRWNQENKFPALENEAYKTIFDCDNIIVSEIDSKQIDLLKLHGIIGLKTKETIVTKILMQFLQNILQTESNTCCCP
jgi:predicted Fe-Mo cluster-binding NifX family protein